MSQTTWGSASPLSSQPSSLPPHATATNALSAEHHAFGSFEPGLAHSYGPGENYPAPPHGSSSMTQMASPALSAASKSPNPGSMRSPLPYGSSPAMKFPNQHAHFVATFGSGTYPTAHLIPSGFNGGTPAHMHPTSQPALTDATQMGWRTELEAASGMYAVPSFETSTVPTSQRRSGTRAPSGQNRVPEPKKRRQHTKKEEANFQCQVKGCGKFFSRSYNFKSHMETHDEKREYPFLCQEAGCTKKFVRKTDLQRHHQSVHAKERNHRCDYCGRMFARRDTLRRHMEDGCSKRFDLGTLALRSDSYGDHHNSNHNTVPRRTPSTSMQAPSTLTAIPMLSINGNPSTIHNGLSGGKG